MTCPATMAVPFLLLLFTFLPSIAAQPLCIDSAGNYTTNSTYRASLDTLLSSLSTNINFTGFYSATAGRSPDTAYAVALCRGDVTVAECRNCIRTAATVLSTSCDNRNQAVTWNEQCLIRYSNQPILGTPAITSPKYYWWNPNNATSPDRYEEDLRSLLDRISEEAAAGGSLRKVAGGNVTGPDFQRIFALVQCTPDLTPVDCSNCLGTAAQDIPRCCDRKRGGRVLQPSCTLRFESYEFFNQTRLLELTALTTAAPAPVAPPPPPPVGGSNNSNKTRNIIIVVVAVVGCSIIALIIGIVFFTKRRKQHLPLTTTDENEISSIESLQYDFGTIRDATNDFSHTNKLGEGGFGSVYKGKLPNGREIAVKRLSKDSGQGIIEFKNEVLLLARLQHRNLVRLLGFALEGMEKLLVYEFLPNGSLDLFLFDSSKNSKLDWDIRHKIIFGIAKGMLYLHEDSRLKIIHRDLKASNILLDEEMNAKIADFGMAKLCGHDETQGTTSKIVGTYGYMSPEYAMHGQFSIKSDVFSFGVLLLEIISGRKNNNFQSGDAMMDLLSFAWKNWNDGTFINIVDPLLRSSIGSTGDIQRCIHIGLLCVQENSTDRPTMASIVLMLNSFSITLSVPSEPAFYLHSRGYSQFSSLMDTNSSKSHKSGARSDEHKSDNECSITDLYPR